MNKRKSVGLSVFIIISVIITATLLIVQYLRSVNQVLRALSRRLSEDDFNGSGGEDEEMPVEVENVKEKE